MQMRYWILASAAACCLALNGCNQTAPTPPPDATTETPLLDIDEGIEMAPDEIAPPADAATPDAAGDAAAGDAGTATGGP